jgi:raffinose/stachyose/melibiose transport system substrate-binding protein
MKPRRLLHAVLLLGSLYALSLVHVWRNSRSAETGATPVVTLRFGHWQLETGIREAFDVVAQRYMALNPGVRVEQYAIPGPVYRQWLTTQLAGGTVPDLVTFDPTDPSLLAQVPRHFEVLTPWLAEPNPYNAGTALEGVPWRDTFIDRGRNRITYLNPYRNFFAVGLSSHSMRMFYNRDLLIEITGDDDPPADFRAWLELGEKVRAYRPGLAHVAGARDNTAWILPSLVNQAVARWLARSDYGLRFATTSFDFFGDLLDGHWDLHSPPVQAALRLAQAYGGEMPAGFLQRDRDAALQSFLRGQALTIPTGTWDYPSMRRQADFAIGGYRLPLPADDDPEFGGYALHPVSEGGASTALPFFLTRQSRHQAVAIDFLRFLTGVEGNTLFSRTSHWMPGVEGVEIAPELQPFRQVTAGYLATDAQSGPILLRGPGTDTARLIDTHFHLLYAPDGGVDLFARRVEPQFATAVRQDLERQLSHALANLRQRDTTLLARDFIGGAEREAAHDEIASQHLVEVQAALLQQRLSASP